MPHNVPPIGVPPPTTETNMPNLPMLRQPYGVGPAPPMQMQLPQQQHHSDDMDVEMEDAMPQSLSSNLPKDKPNLSDQLIAAMNISNTMNDCNLASTRNENVIERTGKGETGVIEIAENAWISTNAGWIVAGTEEEDEIAVEIDGEIIAMVVIERGMRDAIETAVRAGRVERAALDTRRVRVCKIKIFRKARA